jgi:diguanylate cyclase (GGDEF)-like protein
MGVLLGAVVLASLAFLLLVGLDPGGASVTRNVDDVAQAAAPLLVAVPACWWAAARSQGRRRRYWALLACFAASWGIGQVIWCYLELSTGSTPGTDSIASVGYLLAPLFAVAALFSFGGPKMHWAAGVRATVDGLLVASSLLFVAWTIAPITGALARSGATTGQQITVLTYPAADIVMRALLATVIARSVRTWRDPLVAVGGCFLALLLGDSLSIYVGLSGTYSTGSLLDIFWFVAFLLLAVGATMPVPNHVPVVEELKPPLWTEFITHLPIALAVSMAVGEIASGHGFDVVGQVLALTAIVLLAVRGYLFVMENRGLLTRLEGTVTELQWLALHDPLTGLANRVLFMDRLELALSQRHRGVPDLAVAYLDLDEFKHVNDSHGHDVGDELLRQASQRLTSSIREGDTLARLSGDEFAILLTSPEDVLEIETVLRRMIDRINRLFDLGGRQVTTSVSIGYVIACDGRDADEQLRRADQAMYLAKPSGKNRICRYDPATEAAGGLVQTTDALGVPDGLERTPTGRWA